MCEFLKKLLIDLNYLGDLCVCVCVLHLACIVKVMAGALAITLKCENTLEIIDILEY